MIASLLLIATALAGQAPAADVDALKAEVRTLVRQLDSPRLEKRQSAEKRLVELGPEVLPLLPEPNADLTAEVKQRVDSIRHQVQETAAKTSAQASPITLHSPGDEAVENPRRTTETERQPHHRRRGNGPAGPADPELKVDFDSTPFWQALDDGLDQAGLSVYRFGQQHALCIVPRSPGQVPRTGRASYSGPFRFEADPHLRRPQPPRVRRGR